ncbi:MAG: Gx transporter family protein [Oscillospiraceae bacterium]|nr:Gx transporter family protein [Oscillospiraceae bacterium]
MSKTKTRVDPRTRKLALLGILAAQALALAFLENLIPAIPGLPPGAKPGLANIVTMFTASVMGFWSAMAITVIKSLFALITRGFTAFCMSLTGGVLSTIVMVLLLRWKKNPFGILGVSILSAIMFNAGQLAVACIMLYGTKGLVQTYGPLLLVFGIIAGALTGTILKLVLPALEKESRHFGLEIGETAAASFRKKRPKSDEDAQKRSS